MRKLNTNVILVTGIALIIVFAFMHFYQIEYYIEGIKVRSENPYSAGLLDWLVLGAGIILVVCSEVFRHFGDERKVDHLEELEQNATGVIKCPRCRREIPQNQSEFCPFCRCSLKPATRQFQWSQKSVNMRK